MKIKAISILSIAVITSVVLYGFNKEENKEKANVNCNKISQFTYGLELENKPNNELSYVIKRKDNKIVTPEKLKTANTLSDFIEYFPYSWIYKYESVSIGVAKKGKETKASSKNNFLTLKQKQLLRSVELSDIVTIHIKYSTKNPVSDKEDKNIMNFMLKVAPKHEAEFVGGYFKMIQYLKKKTGIEILNWATDVKNRARLHFWVNKEGKVVNLTIQESSGQEKVDEELIELLESMPKWDPAKTDEGKPVMQEFEFMIGGDMC